MSDKKDAKKQEKPAEEGTPAAASPVKKGLPIKMIGIIAGIMVAEGAALFFVLGATGKAPQAAHAVELQGKEHADEEQTVEVPLVEEEFQTMQGTQIWIWDTQMVLQVKRRNEKYVTEQLERRKAEVHDEIAKIFRKAQPNQLREPGLETINRQVTAYLQKMMGKDADGHARIEKLLIPRCRGFFAN